MSTWCRKSEKAEEIGLSGCEGSGEGVRIHQNITSEVDKNHPFGTDEASAGCIPFLEIPIDEENSWNPGKIKLSTVFGLKRVNLARKWTKINSIRLFYRNVST